VWPGIGGMIEVVNIMVIGLATIPDMHGGLESIV